MIAAARYPSRTGPQSLWSLEELLDRAGVLPFTVEQYTQLIERGILPEDASVELLCGVIIRKDRSSPGEDPMGHGPLHRLVISLLIQLAAKIEGPGRHMQVQLPVVCPPFGAPEPDASIIHGQPRDYALANPTADDAACVIEVAHSSLHRDRIDKSATYAAGGIGQYVIINLFNSSAEVYTDPDRAGQSYRTRTTLERGDTLTLSLPDGTFTVPMADLLP